MSPEQANTLARLEIQQISKSFPGVRALRSVDLRVCEGEVVGLLGENGAGKSTLVKILSGVHPADSGTVRLDGTTLALRSPADALRAGIATVFQEGMIVPNLTVAANVMLGREAGRWFVDDSKTARAARDVLDALRIDIPIDRSAGTLVVAERQLIEIARAVSLQAKAVVLDEPTAALTPPEVARLFEAIRRLRGNGIPVIYITHRLEEVPVICDRVVVLRDGAVAGELNTGELDRRRIVSLMVGREITSLFPPRSAHKGEAEVVLDVRGIRWRDTSTATSISVKAGEILALTGLVGGGQKEFARAIFGADEGAAGEVSVNGRQIARRTPVDSVRAGVAYVSGDRQREGVVPEMDVGKNLTLAALRRLSALGFIRSRLERRLAASLRTQFDVRVTSLAQPMKTLSGGNQQKSLIARWAGIRPSAIILDDPTLGVDVGARHEVYEIIRAMADDGVAVVVVSSDVPEVVGISDRIIVFARGQIVAELDGSTATEAEVLEFATRSRSTSTEEGLELHVRH